MRAFFRFSVAAEGPVPDADRFAGFVLNGMVVGTTFASAVPSGDGRRSFALLSLPIDETLVELSRVFEGDVWRG